MNVYAPGQQFVMVRDGARDVHWYANEINYVIARVCIFVCVCVCRQCMHGFEIIVLPEAAEVQPGLKVVGSVEHHTDLISRPVVCALVQFACSIYSFARDFPEALTIYNLN